MASSTTTKNLRDGSMQVWDGTGTPLKITLDLLEGNLTFTETINTVNVLDRGSLDHQRTGDEAAVTGSFTAKYTEFISDSGDGPLLYEVLTDTGEAASDNWISTSATATDVWTLTVYFSILDPDTADSTRYENVKFSKFSPTSIEFSEGDEFDTIAVSFQAFEVRPTITKTAATPT